MPSKRLIKDPVKYKTVLCTTWATTGQCPYNRKCQFAHGKDELRQRTAPSPPQPPQQPRQPGQMPPMMLPAASGMPGSSGAGLMGLPMSAMGQWCQPVPPLPSAMPPSSSSAAPQRSLLGMPPLPPGPPPSSILPQAPLAAPAVGPPQPPSLPQLPLPAMLPLGTIVEAAGAPADSVPAPAAAPAPSMAPPLTMCPPSVYADELACFAMKCHLADDDDRYDDSSLLGKTDVAWEPLRCNEVTGKVEVPYSVDSPVEPTLGKVGRQVSYPTQVVRRAISFVFDDGPNSPVNVRRNTAMAA